MDGWILGTLLGMGASYCTFICRLCHHEGCFVTPTYNYPNEKKRVYCVTHKVEGMVSQLLQTPPI